MWIHRAPTIRVGHSALIGAGSESSSLLNSPPQHQYQRRYYSDEPTRRRLGREYRRHECELKTWTKRTTKSYGWSEGVRKYRAIGIVIESNSKFISGAELTKGPANQVAVEFTSSPIWKSPAGRKTGVIGT